MNMRERGCTVVKLPKSGWLNFIVFLTPRKCRADLKCAYSSSAVQAMRARDLKLQVIDFSVIFRRWGLTVSDADGCM